MPVLHRSVGPERSEPEGRARSNGRTGRCAAALLALAALASCSRANDDAHFTRVLNLCDELAASHGSAADGVRTFGKNPDQTLCEPMAPLDSGDACAYAPTPPCALRWTWLARDEGLCGYDGCRYGCELRVPADDLAGPSCAGQFLQVVPSP